MIDQEIKILSSRWWDLLRLNQQSLLFSKYPMINGNSVVEHVALMYLYEHKTTDKLVKC